MNGSEWFGSRPGGLNRYFEDLYSSLRQRHDVSIDAVAFGKAPNGGASWGPVGSSMLERIARSQLSQIRRPMVDVSDSHFALYISARSRGKLNVIHFQGPWAQESAQAGAGQFAIGAKRRFERAVYRRADRVIVLSEAFKQIAVGDYGVEADRVEIIPPGVNLTKFRPGPNPSPGFYVVCVRRLEKRMGLDNLLMAWRLLLETVPHARLDIFGTGSELEVLRRAAMAREFKQSVALRGRASDSEIIRAYQTAHCSVVPSVALEGFGLVALESLACGTPVIVSDCGGLPDGVRNLDQSLIVRAGDYEQLAERLVLAAGGNLPTRENCRSHAELFAWEKVADAHVRLYREALWNHSN